MAESRKKQSRKNKEYVQTVKNNDFTQKLIFRQPTWSANESFAISGETLEMLANFVAPYRSLINTVDSILSSGELEGKINISFFYEDRTPVPNSDPRLTQLVENEEKRLERWRELVSAKQKSLEELAEKAKEAEARMTLENTKEITEEFNEYTESEGEVEKYHFLQ